MKNEMETPMFIVTWLHGYDEIESFEYVYSDSELKERVLIIGDYPQNKEIEIFKIDSQVQFERKIVLTIGRK